MKRGIRGGWLAAVFLAAIADPLAGQEVAAGLEFDRYHLDNGLEVILAQDHSVPVVAVNVWYQVGAANERPGRTGFAHLFEHMMFQGSANIDKGEHMQLIERAGGSMNGAGAAAGTLAGSRSHAQPRRYPGEPGQPARGGEGGAAVATGQRAVWSLH